MTTEFRIPGGREKDKPLGEASDSALNFWIGRIGSSLEEDPNRPYADRDKALLVAMNDEIARRASGADGVQTAPGTPRPARTAPASQTTGIQVVGESIASGGNLMAALQRLSETCLLVAPTTAIDALPEGCAIAISMVRVDPALDGYPIVGDAKNPRPDDHIGLAKSAIESIGAAAGASWIPGITGRADDGRDPHYRHYVAWAEYMDLDGSTRRYNGECEIDLRDNSPQTLDIIRKAQKNGRDPNVQLAEARKFISRQCASKAMLVALRRPGLRHWYPRHVLEKKPFAVTKLIFHGRTQDPALKQLFGRIIAERFSGAKRQLFGQSPSMMRHSAPPIGTVPIDTHGVECPAKTEEDDFPY